MSLPVLDMQFSSEELRDATVRIGRDMNAAGGRALVVGGCVRDAILGYDAKDVDIEVYGVAPNRLMEILSAGFDLDLVGESFGVIKIKGLPIDVSIPRRESKKPDGSRHTDFIIRSDPHMSVEEAAGRRDFTINSMAFDILSHELIDPFEGMRDLRGGILRHTSDKFSEDALRVLRAMQFAARFDFEVAPETVELCRSIPIEGLPAERIFDEWKKLILKGQRPSQGLRFLRDCGWIRHFPELAALIGCEQDPEWHPEGDVWEHTLHVMDAFAGEKLGDEWEDLVVGFACLCHDFGKPETTAVEDGRICSREHEAVGVAPTGTFLQRMTNQADLLEQVAPLVRDHLKPLVLHKQGAGKAAIRRLALRVGRIDRLVRVARADHKGRPPKQFDGLPAGDWLLEQARLLDVHADTPKPIVLGRHLIELGCVPGPHFGTILEACFEAQLDGKWTTLAEGIEHAREIVDAAAPGTDSSAGGGHGGCG